MPSVLLVEDDTATRNAYAYALKKEGFQVKTAANGGDALAWAQNEQFDVVVLDLLMMGMSGLDFLRAYDIRNKSPKTKVIALTNFTENPELAERAEVLGVQEYLDKAQYEPRDLALHIKKILI